MKNKILSLTTYLSIALMSLVNSIQIVFGTTTLTQLLYLFFFALFVFLGVGNISFRYKWIPFLTIAFFFVLAFVFNGFSTISLLVTLFLISFSPSMDIKNMIKALIIPRYFIFVLTIALCLFKVLPNVVVYRETLSHEIINYRYSLGFPHPNIVFWFIFPAFIGYVYLRVHKIKLFEMIVHLGVFTFLYWVTDCRTGFICVLTFAIFVAFYKYCPRITRRAFGLKVWRFIYIIPGLLSILLPYLMHKGIFNALFEKLDLLTSYRLSLSANAFSKYGLTLLGQNIEYSFTIDNSYVYLAQSFGLVFLIFFFFVTYFILRYLQKNHHYLSIIVLVVFAVYFVFEKVFFNLMNNFSLLMIAYLFTKSKEVKQRTAARVLVQ